MTDLDTLRDTVIGCVLDIAPEADFSRVNAQRSLREQLDLDSFDFLNLLIALHEKLGVQVPESDYAQVDSLDGLVNYLAQRSSNEAP
ncbi:MAG: acyl carrier protein [Pseudomonadota bacterium]